MGVDFTETFSSVIKPTIVQVVLALSVLRFDFSNAFQHGALKEEVFIEQPCGFIDPIYSEHLYRLKKALYGFKQAS